MIWKSFGHNWQKGVLEKVLKKSSHAYLFSGPKGIGKLNMAKDFTKGLLKDGKNDDEIFRKIDENIFPDCIIADKLWIEDIEDDLVEIYKYSNFPQDHRKKSNIKTDTIGIDDIHEIIKLVNKSSIGNKKVIIIRDIERMNQSSINAFLKTIEEPPLNTFFVCTSSNNQSLSNTILSRLQEIKFNLLSDNDIEKYITNKYGNKLSKTEIENIIKFSFGRIDYAENLSHNLGELCLIENKLKLIGKIYNEYSITLKIQHTDTIWENISIIKKEIELWEHFLRNEFYKISIDKQISIINDIENLFQLKKDIDSNINKKLALEKFYFNLNIPSSKSSII